ncbi:hypothetical protein BRADI_1g56050v3 [Brachypodium distachyon]|uniref:Uncharacterized protein n=1 Tax=Brachypodium distachyon TaxID=15368 RepID=I1H3A4_BRADI|nr:hypothetical protein BRADI_1g56050v3 [Brachypodium distachyon]
MLCPLVSPGPLRRVPLLFGSEPPTPAHVAVDIPEGELEVDGEETAAAASGHIKPVCRVVVRAVFVAYTAFAVPALVATAVTRFGGGDLRALLVLLLVVLTVAALFMATVRVSEDEDMEREEEQEEQDQEKGLHGSRADED